MSADEIIARGRRQNEGVREFYVQRELNRLIREDLAECYRREPISHLKKCSHLAHEYLRQVLKRPVPAASRPAPSEADESHGAQHDLPQAVETTNDPEAL